MKIKQINDLIHQVKNLCFSTKSDKLYYTSYRPFKNDRTLK